MDSDDEDEPLPWPAASSPADDAGSTDEALPSASGSSGMVLEEALADDDNDDDDDDKDVAEAPFEIADHTTVTAWERLVAALEDLLRRWKLDAPNGVLPDTAHAASIAYDGQPYELQYHHHHHHRASASAAPAAPSVGPVPAVLQRHFGDRTTDFAQVRAPTTHAHACLPHNTAPPPTCARPHPLPHSRPHSRPYPLPHSRRPAPPRASGRACARAVVRRACAAGARASGGARADGRGTGPGADAAGRAPCRRRQHALRGAVLCQGRRRRQAALPGLPGQQHGRRGRPAGHDIGRPPRAGPGRPHHARGPRQAPQYRVPATTQRAGGWGGR